MKTAYWNEPVPLKREYPEGTTWFEAWMVAIGMAIGIFALCVPDPSGKAPFPDSVWSMLFLMVGLLCLAAVLVCCGIKLGPKYRAYLWRKVFIKNNTDLNLDLKAIKQVKQHLIENTGYLFTDFDDVAVPIASYLRDGKQKHTTFTDEVLHAYRFFAHDQGQLLPTRCPKR